MATSQPALQAELERDFEVLGNGWLPVQAEPVTRITAPERCHKPVLTPAQGSWMLRLSPVKLLFKGRVDMDKVRDWFMQTTETRSLAITRRCQFRKRLPEPRSFPLAEPGPRKSPRRKGAVRPQEGKPPPGRIQAAAGGGGRRRRWRKRRWKGGAALGRRIRIRRRRRRRDLKEAGWRRKLVQPERRAAAKRQRETPPADPRGQAAASRADKTPVRLQEQQDWSELPSPPVLLHVRGTDYKLVPVGNRLPAARDPMPHLGSRSPPAPRDHQQQQLLGQLGCLRQCWVLLRNIADPRAQHPSLSKAQSPPPSSSSSSGKIRSRRKRSAPAYCSGRAHRQKLLPTPRAKSRVQPAASSDPAEDLPARPEPAPASPLQQAAAATPQPQSPPRPLSPPPPEVQQESHLSDVKWQLVCLKECRVTLRKIKESSPPNGLAVCRPSSCKRPDPNLESAKDEKVGKTVRFAGAGPSCEENRRKCLAASKSADIPAVAEGLKQHQGVDMGKQVRNTFADTKWNRRGLKDCYVVLKRISPLEGYHFANRQIFTLGRDYQNL